MSLKAYQTPEQLFTSITLFTVHSNLPGMGLHCFGINVEPSGFLPSPHEITEMYDQAA